MSCNQTQKQNYCFTEDVDFIYVCKIITEACDSIPPLSMCRIYLPFMTLINSHQELDAQVGNDGWKWFTVMLCVVSPRYMSETEMEVNDAEPVSLTYLGAAQPAFCVTLRCRGQDSSQSSIIINQKYFTFYL